MDPLIYITLLISVLATLGGFLSKSSKKTIYFLFLQAAAIGFVELMYVFINLVQGLHTEALIKFFATFAEWISAAIISPLIIWWGVSKTEDYNEKSMIKLSGVISLLSILIIVHLGLEALYNRYLPSTLEATFFFSMMLSLSLILMITRKDPFKILVGLNMAENSLYPLLTKSPINILPIILVLIMFVNVVAVFIIIEAYGDYNTLDVSKWRLSK